MKSRGPKRTPTAELQRRGSHLGRSREQTEPRLTDRDMQPPEWLNADARDYFATLTELLRDANLDKKHFTLMLAGLAHWLDVFVRASREMEGEPLTLEGVKGGKYQHPAINTACAAWKQVVSIAAEFGMSPSSISKVAGDLRGEELDDYELWDLSTRGAVRKNNGGRTNGN